MTESLALLYEAKGEKMSPGSRGGYTPVTQIAAALTLIFLAAVITKAIQVLWMAT